MDQDLLLLLNLYLHPVGELEPPSALVGDDPVGLQRESEMPKGYREGELEDVLSDGGPVLEILG